MKDWKIWTFLTIIILLLIGFWCILESGGPKEIADPGSGDVLSFLQRDKTECQNYSGHKEYTYKFLEKAKEAGLRGYLVVVKTANRNLYFAGFNTTDRGWVYILPVVNKQVNLIEGRSYQVLNNDYATFGPRDIVIVEITKSEFLN